MGQNAYIWSKGLDIKFTHLFVCFSEKEHDKLLAHSEAVKSVHYGDQAGASVSIENSLTSQGKAQDAAKLKSLAVCKIYYILFSITFL
jgi:hypothetical protein